MQLYEVVKTRENSTVKKLSILKQEAKKRF